MIDTTTTTTNTTTASGTCHRHHQLRMLRNERLKDDQDQQREHSSPRSRHHHQHNQHQQQRQKHCPPPQQPEDDNWSSSSSRTSTSNTSIGSCSTGRGNNSSIHKHLAGIFCLLLVIVCNVEAGVRILVEPTNKSVSKGKTVVLKCTVVDRGAGGRVQWSQSGFGLGEDRSLPGFDRYSMIGEDQGNVEEYNLQIHDAQVSDEGDYHCQVFGSSAAIRSRTAHLEVVVPPGQPQIIKDTPNVPVVLHRPTEILCQSVGGKPAPTISWHINGQRVTEGVTVRQSPDGQQMPTTTGVLIYNASREDAAKRIECQVLSQFMDSPFRAFANLDVQYAPNITMSHNVTGRSIQEHDWVRFQCSFTANPSDVTWTWYRNDDPIESATGNIYHIINVDPSYNKDVISCVGGNGVGTSRVDMKLNVEYGPRITKITEWVGTDIGQPAKLECLVDGNPVPSVIWRRRLSNRFMHGAISTNKVLTITRVDAQSFGYYTCTATVEGFRDESKDALVIKNGIPQAQSQTSQEAEKGKRATLECKVASIPLPNQVKWYRRGIELTEHMFLNNRFKTSRRDALYVVTYFLTISKVKDGDFGYYNCSVTNDYGTTVVRIELKEKQTLPVTYIIVGAILGFAVIFVIILVVVLYRRHFKKDDVGSVLGSYTDTDSSSDKKIRKDADSPSTLMGQLRQGYTKDQYRFSADYDDMPYKEHVNGNNNGYRYIDTSDTYSDQNIYDGEYIRSDLGHTDRIVPLYSPTAGYNLSSFRGNNYDNGGTPPPTMSRLTPLHMSNSKLATDV